MRKLLSSILVIGMALILAGQSPLRAQTKLDPYLEIELKRLEETYRLMDKYAQKIWPGWNNYMEIEFKVQYPNLVQLLVNPREEVPEGYEAVPGRTLRGKKIYVSRKEELPIKIQPPLTGGGGGGLSIIIWMQENKLDQAEADKAVAKAVAEKNFTFMPPGSSDNEIVIYVHEFFHGYQSRAVKSMREMEERREKARKERAENEKAGKGVKPRAVRPETELATDRELEGKGFQVNPEYATYASIEGQALSNAYEEKNKARAIECLKDFSVAREIKHTKHMPADAAAQEARQTLMEGTAVYANTKMLMLIRDKKYKPAMTSKDDPFFYGFKFADGKIAQDTTESMKKFADAENPNTLDTLGPCYTYGVYQCFLMDRFFPGWKKGVFENGLTLDEALAAKLKLTEKEKAAIAERLKTKYDYDKLYAKHTAVIADRDATKKIVTDRKGRTYIIDLHKTKEIIVVSPRKNSRFVTVSVSGYYVNGIEEYTLGDIVLTTWNTPIHKPFLHTIEWTDTEVKGDEKNYVFYYDKQDGDVYKNVVFATPGFTLKAPEVKIKELKDKNEFWIVIQSKVAR
jgi:formaldehyde-activating enzyme involved in methanogenesis